MGSQLEPNQAFEIEKMRAQNMRRVIEKLPTVLGGFGVFVFFVSISVLAWSGHRYEVEQRVKEVEAASKAGLVEQAVFPNRATWVARENYKPTVISWD